MMPFHGRRHIAYTPVERVVGLSKLARRPIPLVLLQTQEHSYRPDRGGNR